MFRYVVLGRAQKSMRVSQMCDARLNRVMWVNAKTVD